MPELPEVEIIRRIIEPQIAGKEIQSVIINNAQIIGYPDSDNFTELLNGQTIVAGIGNIYSDEILSAAGIYPEERCMDLEDNDWTVLTQKIKEIIAWGIDTNEMTPEEYLAGKGKEYSNIPNLRVYGREGQKCYKCDAVIERIVIGGRSSCYCPICQKKGNFR